MTLLDAPTAVPSRTRLVRERAAMLLATVGLVTLPIGWTVAVVLASWSRRWSLRQKLVVTLVPVPIVVLGTVPVACDDDGTSVHVGTGAIVVWALVTVVAMVLLWRRTTRDARSGTPSVTPAPWLLAVPVIVVAVIVAISWTILRPGSDGDAATWVDHHEFDDRPQVLQALGTAQSHGVHVGVIDESTSEQWDDGVSWSTVHQAAGNGSTTLESAAKAVEASRLGAGVPYGQATGDRCGTVAIVPHGHDLADLFAIGTYCVDADGTSSSSLAYVRG